MAAKFKTCPDAFVAATQAAYLYVVLERAGVKPAQANASQMRVMVRRLAELSPPSEGIPPIAEHLHSMGINAAAPQAVSSIAIPAFHNMAAARRTLDQPASLTFQRLLPAASSSMDEPEPDASLVWDCIFSFRVAGFFW